MVPQSKRDCALPLLTVVALTGVIAVLVGTRWGPGIEPDSVFYLSEAHNLLDGRGFRGLTDPTGDASDGSVFVPTTVHPPAYPGLLALGGLLGINMLSWARWLNAILFGATILLVGIVIHQSTRGSLYPALLGAVLVLSSVDMINIHTKVMSDPVFIFSGSLGLVLLAAYLKDSKNRILLIASSASTGLAFLSRYPGAALVITGIAGVSLLGRTTLRRRTGDALVFAALSVFPMALWTIPNLFVAGGATGRAIVFHPMPHATLVSALLTFSRWVIPNPWRADLSNAIGITVVAVMGGFVATALMQRGHRDIRRDGIGANYLADLPFLLALFILVYAVFMIANIAFRDDGWVGRYLAPSYVSAVVLIVSLATAYIRPIRTRLFGSTIIFLFVALAGAHIIWAGARIHLYYREGQGYTRQEWRDSPTIQRLREFPSGVQIYTNAPDVVYFLAGKLANWIPPKTNYLTRLANKGFADQIAAMGGRLKSRKAVLVYFANVTWRSYLPSEQELQDALPFLEGERTFDGSIYTAQSLPSGTAYPPR